MTNDEMERHLQQLSPRRRLVLENFYGLNGKPAKSANEIASMIERTPQRVYQIKKGAEDRVRFLISIEQRP
jgi:DNA-directed RNA polymerase sigma subunit (sigma70/sigma32)